MFTISGVVKVVNKKKTNFNCCKKKHLITVAFYCTFGYKKTINYIIWNYVTSLKWLSREKYTTKQHLFTNKIKMCHVIAFKSIGGGKSLFSQYDLIS